MRQLMRFCLERVVQGPVDRSPLTARRTKPGLHERHVLVRRGMDHHVGAMSTEDQWQRSGVVYDGGRRQHPPVAPLAARALHQFGDYVLSATHRSYLGHAHQQQVPHEHRTDRTAGAGHQHRALLQVAARWV